MSSDNTITKIFIPITLSGEKMWELLLRCKPYHATFRNAVFDDDCLSEISRLGRGDRLIVETLRHIARDPREVPEVLRQAGRDGITVVSLQEPWFTPQSIMDDPQWVARALGIPLAVLHTEWKGCVYG